MQEIHQNLRILQLGKRAAELPAITLNLENNDQMEYILRRVLEENALIDLASNKYSRALPADNTSRAGRLPINSPNQMIYVIYDSQRNKLIVDSIGRSAGSNTLFLPYRTKGEACEHISKLNAGDLTLVICNDDDIRKPQRCTMGLFFSEKDE